MYAMRHAMRHGSSPLDSLGLNSSAMDSSALDSSAMDSSAILYKTSQVLIVCYDSYKQIPNKFTYYVDVAVHVGKCIQGPCSAVPDIQSIREYGNFPNN